MTLVFKPQTSKWLEHDMRSSVVKDTSQPPCLHLPAKPTVSQFDKGRRVYLSGTDTNKSVSQKLAWRATARPQCLSPSHSVSRVKGSVSLNDATVAGCSVTEWPVYKQLDATA